VKPSRRVFFPWERRRGLWGAIGRARARFVVAAVALVALVVFIHRREEHAAAVRATRATIDTAFHALIRYRADHAGACPRGWKEMVAGAYLRDVPLDAWGRPLRLTCPGRRDKAGFDLESDGPDGLPGGLDRVE
jgi:general secretion pathway protein G